MKRLIACILLLVCCATSAFADTREDLIDIINEARLLLTRFYPPVANGSVLYEDKNIRMTAISQPYFAYWSIGDPYGTIYIDVVIENYMDVDILGIFPEIAVNGWTLEGFIIDEVLAKKKIQTSIMIDYIADTDLTTPEDIETIEGVFAYIYADSCCTIRESEFYWMFNVNTNMYDHESTKGEAHASS